MDGEVNSADLCAVVKLRRKVMSGLEGVVLNGGMVTLEFDGVRMV